MTTALIGYTGFVGSNLLRQGHYDLLYCGDNIEEIRHTKHDRIVCAGAPGVKWAANEHPVADFDTIRRLGHSLEWCSADQFTLISTVDVRSKSAYGRHRRWLEDGVRWVPPPSEPRRFGHVSVVRLPALFGPGLKKNVLWDLMHGHMLDRVHPDSTYQWYPVRRLSTDLEWIESSGKELTTLATEPISTRDIIDRFFPGTKVGYGTALPVHQDIKPYVLSREQVLAEMELFLEEERNGRTHHQGLLATAH